MVVLAVRNRARGGALVLLARESPLHLGHLRAMAAVTEMGAIVMPPVPAFYLLPRSTQEIVDQVAARAIDLVGIAAPSAVEWGTQVGEPGRP